MENIESPAAHDGGIRFTRQLNRTASLMLLGMAGLILLFIWLSFGFQFPYWLYIYRLNTPALVLLALLALAWLALYALGYAWVLYRKNRSQVFLAVLFPYLAAVIGCVVFKLFWFSTVAFHDYYPGVTYMTEEETSQVAVFTACLIALFVINGVVLRSLKNKQPLEQANQSRYSAAAPRLRRAALAVAGLNAVLLVAASLFINLGYVTYHSPDDIDSYLPVISFEYPADSNEPEFWHTRVFKAADSEEFQYVDTISFYYRDGGGVSIQAVNQDVTATGGPGKSLEDQTEGILREYANPPEYQRVVESEVMVGDIPARQIAIAVDDEYELANIVDRNDTGNNFYVLFLAGDTMWEICCFENRPDAITTTPPARFVRLLESFTIHGE